MPKYFLSISAYPWYLQCLIVNNSTGIRQKNYEVKCRKSHTSATKVELTQKKYNDSNAYKLIEPCFYPWATSLMVNSHQIHKFHKTFVQCLAEAMLNILCNRSTTNNKKIWPQIYHSLEASDMILKSSHKCAKYQGQYEGNNFLWLTNYIFPFCFQIF